MRKAGPPASIDCPDAALRNARPARARPGPRPTPPSSSTTLKERAMPTHRRLAGAIALGVATLGFSTAALADDRPADPIGMPASVEVAPKGATLVGRRATRQLILSASYADGSVRDLT